MKSRVKCFLVEHMPRSRYNLRRYSSGPEKCSGKYSFHNAHSETIAETADDPKEKWHCTNPPASPPGTDPRWPSKCAACDYQFTEDSIFQVWGQPLYKNVETGETYPQDSLPAGAIYRAKWQEDYKHGEDGKAYYCVLPGGHPWFIDGPCNNCTRKKEEHQCWIRKGVAPNFTVGKDGDTCSAGAGSIAVDGYHGFLRNGYLEEC